MAINTNMNNNTKNYTMKDFCNKYNNINIAETKKSLIEKVMNIHYVPYERKITICQKIVENTYYIKAEKNGIETKKFHINSPANYMLYCLNMVNEYTNIDVDFKNSLEEFNIINSCEVLDMIYSHIPEKELKEFRMILEMVENDTMQNEHEVHSFISNQVDKIKDMIGIITKPIMDDLEKMFGGMDKDSILQLVKEMSNES